MSYTSDVTNWYKSVQFRSPPPDELNSLVTQLTNGVPIPTVQQEIIAQPYTLNIVNPVIQEYQAAFNRIADQSGQNFWINSYGSNPLAITQISVAFANTPEFFGLYQSTATTPANLTLLNGIYHNALGRAPDAAGEQFWLNSGLNTSQILQAFAQSAEMTTKSAPYINTFQLGEMAGSPQTSGPLFQTSTPYVSTLLAGIARNDGVNGSSYPPDNALAIGPNNILSSENSAIMWTNLQGGAKIEKNLASFFSRLPADIPTDHIFDPRAIYDTVSNHFVVIADQGDTTTSNYILVATSNTADPNGDWTQQAIKTNYDVFGVPTWADYPMMSVSGKNIYISTNQYSKSGDQESNPLYASYLTVVDSTGATAPVNQKLDLIESFNTAQDPNGGTFLVANTGNALNIKHVTGSKIDSSATLNLGAISSGPINTTPQPGTDKTLATDDSRVLSAVSANGHLYVTFEVNPTQGASGGAAVHWADVNVQNPSRPYLVVQGDILGSSISNDPTTTTSYGSIAVDKSGNIVLAFNAGGKSLYQGDYFIVHKATDPTGVFSAPVSYQAGLTNYIVEPDAKTGASRWGDYASAVSDQNNTSGFWISNEYAVNQTVWSTSIAHVIGFG